MSELSDRDLALETNVIVKGMKEQLLGGPGITGAIPEIKADMKAHEEKDNKRFEAIDKQQSYWRGAIAAYGFLAVVVAGLIAAFIEHVKSGK